MKPKDIRTEEAILGAARKVFLQKGMEGARMQEIADEAGINKALLHYYYRNKEKLFEAIFREAYFEMMNSVLGTMNEDRPLFEKIEFFIRNVIDFMIRNPYIPGFIIHEINRDPGKIVSIFMQSGMKPPLLIRQINEEIKQGRIRRIEPRQLIVNILAMCIFPVIARPILTSVLFEGDAEAYTRFLERRKKEVAGFIINSIRVS
jgi:AcrR family transcriptional regulator